MKYYKITWLGDTLSHFIKHIYIYISTDNIVYEHIFIRFNGEIENMSTLRHVSLEEYKRIAGKSWQFLELTKKEYFIEIL